MSSVKVVRVDVDDGLREVVVEDRYQRVLLVVTSRGAFLGQVTVPAKRTLTVESQWGAIAASLGELLWRQRVRTAFTRAARGPDAAPLDGPSVSVIICTKERPEDLRRCLDSLAVLRTQPDEVIVVDNGPGDPATAEVCRGRPVRYLVESGPGLSRARNRGIAEARGEVVAFTDDDCVVDPRWLDGLGDPFDDPLVMAATGYAGPLEMETRAQYLFEAHGGFQRHPERVVFDGSSSSPIIVAATAGAGANSLFRRSVFDEVGPFAEDLGPGTPARNAEEKYAFYRIAAAGYRIVFDPARIVWHRHRRDLPVLRRTLHNYTVGEFAYTTRCLLGHGELDVLRLWRWWPRHLAVDLWRLRRGDDRAIPLGLIAAEAAGIPRGPWTLWRSRFRRPANPPLPSRSKEPQAGEPRVAAGGEAPMLSVVIASRNRRERLREVLATLARQTYPPERFEVVLVLDGSTDGSAEMVRGLELPYPVKLLEQENRGLAATRNRGAREATHEIVVFLDDDIVPEPGFLAEHARAHQGRDGHVALGYYPPVLAEQSLWAYAIRAWWEDHFRRKAEPAHQWTYIDYADGNCSMPRGLLFGCGGYDEDFKGRRQDWELGIRLLQRGVTFDYHPRARGAHHLATGFATALRHARQEAKDDVLLGRKHPQVRGQLPVAGEAGPGPGAPRRVVLLYRRRDAAEAVLRAGPAAADRLERLRLRPQWHRLAHRLLRLSYLAGATEALATPAGFEEFLAPVWDERSVETVPVWLDAPGAIVVPPAAGVVSLSLGYAGRELAATRAIQVAGQWDWREVTERVVQEAQWPMRMALLLRDESWGTAPPERSRPPEPGSAPPPPPGSR